MAETERIAAMASKVSDEIFGVFGWRQVPPINQNSACVMEETHRTTTHPCDVVFAYDDPYRAQTIFWNTDLKSYARGSIAKGKITDAIASLSKSVECANVSSEWRTRYGADEGNANIDGLLFVYNHDGEYDADFGKMLADADLGAIPLPRKRRLAVLGPQDVGYLVNVATDILTLRGRQKIPVEPAATQFFYPDLVRSKRRDQGKSAATIEMLTGPWVTVNLLPQHNQGKREFLVYYRERGETIDEFTHLIDSFFRFQMLTVDPTASIEVRLVGANVDKALPNFRTAKERLSASLYGLPQEQLRRVRCEPISTFVRSFSEVALGMEVC